VSMLENETVMVDKSPVPLEALPGLLRQLKDAEPDRAVMVQGDRRLSYEQLSKLLESLDNAGFNRVGLITVSSAGS
jgi:biopolymer transport protein ExbD